MTGATIPATVRLGNRRWSICALLFFATTVNYLDRAIINALAPRLMADLGWDKTQYGYVTTAFQVAYAIGLVASGGVIDRLGTRKGFAWAVGLWSLAAMATGMARHIAGWLPAQVPWFGVAAFIPATVLTFTVARSLLGLAEAGNFPAAVKTVAEWFPRKERALATGIFNAGTNVGAVLAPLAAVYITLWWGWEWAFISTGAAGFAWLAFWLTMYRKPEEDPGLTRAELDHILSDPPEPATKIPWASILPFRQTWAFSIGKFLTDPVWWFWLFWLGIFLKDRFDVKLEGIAAPLVFIYVAADIGSVAGGWLSSDLIRRGWSVNAARKTAMLICAVCVVPVIGALFTTSMWTAVGLIALAAAAHQAWSCNLFTLVSDTFPRRAVGSVVGFGGMWGAAGSVFLTLRVGPYLKSHKDSYLPFFLIAGCGYIIALLIIHLLAPRLKPADVE
ncbi:MAG TPA: MFS transporter [Armatimonadota bacterium]|jgi:ACS family hexuronate transporter-like MFS transporter